MSRKGTFILFLLLLMQPNLLSACESNLSLEGISESTNGIASPKSDIETIAARIDEYMQESHQDFSGTIFVAQDDEVIISQGYGLADREHDVPNSSETKYVIASITKSFTAMAIMILEERGVLGLNDSLCDFISDCPDDWKSVTIHHALTHTSGIPDYFDLAGQGLINKPACFEYDPVEFMSFFKDYRLEFIPGSQWKYSNSGYYVLGIVIESVSGDEYDVFVQENILQPLGMEDTGYNHADQDVRNLASGYSLGEFEIINARCVDVSISYAAGGFYSTVGDLYKWDQALQTNQLVSEETTEAIFTPWAVISGTDFYGYGWFISEYPGHRRFWHPGSTDGFAADFARYQDDDLTIIVLSNFDMEGPGGISEELFSIIMEEY